AGALAATHAGLGRLLGNRLVGEDANEDLATATHEARHHSAGRLDLPVRHPGRFGGLQAELAKRQVVALGGDAGPAASMELAIFDAGWEQHNCSYSSFFFAARGARGVFGTAGFSVVVARARVARLGAGVSPPPSAAVVALVVRVARFGLAAGASAVATGAGAAAASTATGAG